VLLVLTIANTFIPIPENVYLNVKLAILKVVPNFNALHAPLRAKNARELQQLALTVLKIANSHF